MFILVHSCTHGGLPTSSNTTPFFAAKSYDSRRGQVTLAALSFATWNKENDKEQTSRTLSSAEAQKKRPYILSIVTRVGPNCEKKRVLIVQLGTTFIESWLFNDRILS